MLGVDSFKKVPYQALFFRHPKKEASEEFCEWILKYDAITSRLIYDSNTFTVFADSGVNYKDPKDLDEEEPPGTIPKQIFSAAFFEVVNGDPLT